MPKVVLVDLDKLTVTFLEHQFASLDESGRSLSARLCYEYRGRSQRGCLVLAPGLLSGTPVPSTCRLSLAGIAPASNQLHLANIAGPLPQKLASLDIAALVVVGELQSERTLAVQASATGVQLVAIPELRGAPVGQTVSALRAKWDAETAVVGIGPAGERLLALSSAFSTYPASGSPVYHVGRNRLGSVFGGMGLKAVAVSGRAHFSAPAADPALIAQLNKQLGRMIVQHPVCGGALPAYGSITLIKMLRHGHDFATSLTADGSKRPGGVQPGLNRNCGPGCVIGCLNRHAASAEEAYSSPAESEVLAGCQKHFAIDSPSFARALNQACFELGIDSLEFVASVAMYLRAEGLSATETEIWELLNAVRQSTPTGRIVGSGTSGIAKLYADQIGLAGLVTRPSVQEAKQFQVALPHKARGFASLHDLDYLHAYMLGTGNLGICLFTSFAILEHPDGQDLLARLASARVGKGFVAEDIIQSGLNALQAVRGYELSLFEQSVDASVPEFVKVLYRYFAQGSAARS